MRGNCERPARDLIVIPSRSLDYLSGHPRNSRCGVAQEALNLPSPVVGDRVLQLGGRELRRAVIVRVLPREEDRPND